MTGQLAIETLLGPARLGTYLTAAGGDHERAKQLFMWATRLGGALHAQISVVELAVRNAIDPQLRSWNAAQGFSADWTAEGQAADLLYGLLRKPLIEARAGAQRAARERHPQHPRHGRGVTHDDVVAQLMFGAWVKVVRPIPEKAPAAKQQELWAASLHRAFPHVVADDQARVTIGRQLETMRRLRNRVAHHDKLLTVNIAHRLNGMLSLLSAIDPGLRPLLVEQTALRSLAREDPRRAW